MSSFSSVKETIGSKIQVAMGLGSSAPNYGSTLRAINNILSSKEGDENPLGVKKSIDEQVFSDFTYGGEKDFKQEKLALAGNAYHEDPEEKAKKESEQFFQNQAMESMGKFQAEYMDGLYSISIGGINYQFTDEDLEDTIKAIQEDPNAFAAEYGLTEDQASEALILATLLENAKTPEDKIKILQKWGESNPEVAQAVVREVEDHKLKLEDVNNHQSSNKNIDSTKTDASISSVDLTNNQKAADNKASEWGYETGDTSPIISVAKSMEEQTTQGRETKIAFNSTAEGIPKNPLFLKDQEMTTNNTQSLTV